MQRKKEEEKKEEKREEKNRTGSVNAVDLKLDLPVKNTGMFFENLSEWFTTVEAATYLRKFDRNGVPSLNAIHKLVSQGTIERRKFAGRLYFKRKELANLIEASRA